MLLGTGDDPRLVVGGKTHGLRAVESRILERRQSEDPIAERRRQPIARDVPWRRLSKRSTWGMCHRKRRASSALRRPAFRIASYSSILATASGGSTAARPVSSRDAGWESGAGLRQPLRSPLPTPA
jgi:hypothetical protein